MPLDTQQLLQLGIPLAVALLGLFVGFVVRRTLLARLARAAKDTRSTVDDVIVSAVPGPGGVGFFVAGLYAAVHVTRLSPRVVGLIQIVLVVLVILSVSWTLASIAGAALQALAERADIPSATLVNNLARITVLGVGGLMVLNSLGISITPIITALGVGGLAVALALQDTLANLFAGIHILATRKIRPGDYVKLASGEEGYVVDVTWRQTTIRQLPHNIITVPNSEIASTSTTNYNLPHKELSVYVQVGVAYDSDLEHVERVTLEVAKEVMNEVEGGVTGFEPLVRYHTFGDSSINFTLIMRGKEFVNQYLLKHEFIKRLHKRFAEEKIEIPFPIRTIQMQAESER